MKKQVFYIHGGESYDEYDAFLERLRTQEIHDLPSARPFTKWTKTLPSDLGEEFEVFMPQMPNAQNAKYEEWKIWFERHFEHLHSGVILLGCSLGAMFLAKYCTENKTPFTIKALLLMAGALQDAGGEDENCGDFRIDLTQVHKVADTAEEVLILHSKDDFLVPYTHALKLHEAIPGSTLITYEDKNHFLIESFPELTEMLKKL